MADDPWAAFNPETKASDPWGEFNPQGEAKHGLEPEAADHGLSERQKLSPVGKALSPITGYWPTYQRVNQEAREQMAHGVEQIGNSESVLDPQAHGISDVLSGAGNVALGGLGYVASPVSAAYRSIAGQPIEDVTGIPREYTEFGLQMATPGLGLPKSPLSTPPKIVAVKPEANGPLGVTLSEGQATHDLPTVRRESAARTGQSGPPAERTAKEFAEQQGPQVEAARETVERGMDPAGSQVIANSPYEAAEVAGKSFRTEANRAKATATAAYNHARDLPGEIDAQALVGLGNKVKNSLPEDLIIDDQLTPFASKMIQSIDDTISKLRIPNRADMTAPDPSEIVGVNLKGIDQVRKKLSEYRRGAYANNPTDGRAASAMLDAFDDRIDQAVNSGMFNGDPRAVKAWNDARAAYTDYKTTFGKGKNDPVGNVIQKIIGDRTNEPETANALADHLYGASGVNPSDLNVGVAKRMRKVLGEDSPEWAAVRQGLFKRLIDKGEGVSEYGSTNIANRLNKFLNSDGKDLAEVLFTPDQRKLMKQYGDLHRALEVPKGGYNGPETSTFVAPMIKKVTDYIAAMIGGMIGHVVAPGLHGVGEAAGALIVGKGAAISNIRNAKQISQQMPIIERQLKEWRREIMRQQTGEGSKAALATRTALLSNSLERIGIPRVVMNTAEFSGSKNAGAQQNNPQRKQEPEQGKEGKAHGGRILRASGGKIKAEAALPSNHQLGMRVPKGGSSCGSCRFLKSPTECGNHGFVKWNGGRARLPAPKDQYCCDLYESRRRRADGGGVGEILAEDFGDRFFPGYVGRVRGEVSPLATPLHQKAAGLRQDMTPASFDSRWNPGLGMDLHKAEAKPKGYAEGGTPTEEAPPRRLVMDMSETPNVGEPMMGLGAGPFSEGTKFGNRLFGTGGEERYQTWPEKLIRSGLSAAHDTMTGEIPQWEEDPTSGEVHSSSPMIERAQDVAGLAGGAGFGKMGEEAIAQATRAPSLRQYWQPAAKTMSDSSTTGAPLAALEHAPTFYSGLEKAVEAAPITKASGSQWLGTIGKGVKKEEMEYTGTQAFLEQNADKPLTKQQVLDHVSNNKVELGEVHKGELKFNEKSPYALPQVVKAAKQAGETPGDLQLTLANDGNAYRALMKKFPELRENEDWAEIVANDVFGGDSMPTGTAKFEKYQLPGGSNYREKLLTLPEKPSKFDPSQVEIKRNLQSTTQGSTSIWYGGKKIMTYSDDPALKSGGNYEQKPDSHWMDVAKQLFDKGDRINKVPSRSENYQSSHWDEPNVLVHRRTNERDVTGVNGDTKPSLHMEENQSDWHQAGRKRGYDSPAERSKDLNELPEGYKVSKGIMNGEERFEVRTPDGKLIAAHQREEPAIISALNHINDELRRQRGQEGSPVPDAPFKNNWHELAIKDAIREAAEKGFSRISWTPGEAQAARYDLSKQVDSVKYNPNDQLFVAQKDGKNIIQKENVKPEDLPDIIGKDVAEKLLATDTGRPMWKHHLEGQDLKMGGEFHKKLYDVKHPQVFNKIGKPHGVKVEQGQTPTDAPGNVYRDASSRRWFIERDGRMDTDRTFKTEKEALAAMNNGAPVHYMDIPESLKQQALKKGFSLFEDSSVGAPLAALENKKQRATGGRINDNSAALKLAYQVKKARGHHEKFQSHG